MKDPFLLEMTASEPLSLQEEIEMQQSWRDDEDKLTFIMLSKGDCDDVELVTEGQKDHMDGSRSHINFINANLHAMIGDINLFLCNEETHNNYDTNDDIDTKQSDSSETKFRQAELDIMIAVKDWRGKGIGKEAVCMMMLYGAKNLGIRRFIVKVNEDNVSSRALFERKLNFKECNYVKCFQEYELEFKHRSAKDAVTVIKDMFRTDVIEWYLPLEQSIKKRKES